MSIKDVFADTRPLKVPEFRRLWLANIVTVIGAQLTVVAVPTQIYAITQSSAYVGLTGLFGFIPLVLFGLYGGAVADAFDKRKVLLITTIGMIASTAGFWILSVLNNQNVWLLLLNFSLQQAFFAVNQPTRTAVTRFILPLGLLPAGISLNMLLGQIGAIVGPLLAGALLPFTGFSWLYAIDTLSMLTTFTAVFLLPAIPSKMEPGSKAGTSSVIQGLKYLWGAPIILIAMLLDLIAMTFGMPRALYPEISHVNFGEPDGGIMLSMMYSAIAIGAVLGGLTTGWLSRVVQQGKVVVWMVLGWGSAVILAGIGAVMSTGAVTYWAWLVIVGLVLGGIADMFSMVARNAIVQQNVTDELQGRIQGVYLVVVVGGPRLADVVHGAAAEWVSAGWVVIFGGIAVILGTLTCLAFAPQFWRFRATATHLTDQAV
ncbi:MFS transporter [Corynebacterium sp. ZY180755]